MTRYNDAGAADAAGAHNPGSPGSTPGPATMVPEPDPGDEKLWRSVIDNPLASAEVVVYARRRLHELNRQDAEKEGGGF